MWNPSNGFTYDFATIVYRWQLLGFNAIRVPFSMKDLYSTATPTNKLSPTCSLPTFVSTGTAVLVAGVLEINRYVICQLHSVCEATSAQTLGISHWLSFLTTRA